MSRHLPWPWTDTYKLRKFTCLLKYDLNVHVFGIVCLSPGHLFACYTLCAIRPGWPLTIGAECKCILEVYNWFVPWRFLAVGNEVSEVIVTEKLSRETCESSHCVQFIFGHAQKHTICDNYVEHGKNNTIGHICIP